MYVIFVWPHLVEMGPKTTSYSDAEIETLLNFVNANKTILLASGNKHAVVLRKNEKWAEIAGTLSSQGTPRTLQSVSKKWHSLKKDAKREWDQTYVKKPTGGGKAREFSWS